MRAQAALILASFLGQTLTPEVLSAIVREFPRGGQPLDLGQFPAQICGRLTFAAERGADILHELEPLHQAQWAETEKYQPEAMQPDIASCLLDEQEGRLLQLTARAQGRLVGHFRLYVTPSRHTGKRIAVEDTIFLLPEYRIGRNALRLIEFMESSMRVLRVSGIYLDDKTGNPAGGRLLDHLGYPIIANRRFKALHYEEAAHVLA